MEVALQLAPATVAGILYALRAHHLAGTSRAVPGWRRACFLVGLCLIVVAFTSLGSLADQLFWAHMVEQQVIGDLGTLLRVLGLTGRCSRPCCGSASSTACACSPTRSSPSHCGR